MAWTPEATELSRELATSLGQPLLIEDVALKPGDVFPLRSARWAENGITYDMLVLPDGLIVHMDEGCEGEPFNGPLGCWHSQKPRRYVMTQSLTKYETLTPAPIEFSSEQLDVIKRTIAKGATDEELQLFVATCRRTGLDPFLKQIYAIKRYDSKEKKEVMGIQVGIDGLRLTGERTGLYAGMDPLEWLDADGVWSQVWTGAGDHPIAARCNLYRKDFARPVPAVARWESYAQTYTRDGKPHLMPNWEKMPDVMIGKCAEALAYRRAFPAEMSGLAIAVDESFDAEADAEELERAMPAGVIDGEFTPAPPPPPQALHGQEAQDYTELTQRVSALALKVKASLGREAWEPVRDQIQRDYPETLPPNGQGFYPNRVTPEHAPELLRFLLHKQAGVDEHEANYDEDAAQLRCGICGLEMEAPTDEATEQAPLIAT